MSQSHDIEKMSEISQYPTQLSSMDRGGYSLPNNLKLTDFCNAEQDQTDHWETDFGQHLVNVRSFAWCNVFGFWMKLGTAESKKSLFIVLLDCQTIYFGNSACNGDLPLGYPGISWSFVHFFPALKISPGNIPGLIWAFFWPKYVVPVSREVIIVGKIANPS